MKNLSKPSHSGCFFCSQLPFSAATKGILSLFSTEVNCFFQVFYFFPDKSAGERNSRLSPSGRPAFWAYESARTCRYLLCSDTTPSLSSRSGKIHSSLPVPPPFHILSPLPDGAVLLSPALYCIPYMDHCRRNQEEDPSSAR